METKEMRCIAFVAERRVAEGGLEEVAVELQRAVGQGDGAAVAVFDASTSERIELDLRGTAEELRRRLADGSATGAASSGDAGTVATAVTPRGPGRPKLGVVAREVTLLPRHWEWLNGQPGGASVALRKLVEDARRTNAHGDRVRRAQESAYRFMAAMAGNLSGKLPGFEEATRALFGGDARRFYESVAAWPADVREHVVNLASGALEGSLT